MPSNLVGGTSTYSKRVFNALLPRPIHLAEGATLMCDNGMRYLDFTAALGAILLGYEAVKTEALPPLLPRTDPKEERAATLLCTLLERPHWLLRWCKNASDALEGAVRIARHHTPHTRIMTNSYHGSHDALIAATPGKMGGVLDCNAEQLSAISEPEQLLKTLHRQGGWLAAVVMEPETPQERQWPLREIRQLCTEKGILLIFDETLTGWRMREGSIAPEVEPDLAVFGKAIGNGAPIACLTGKPEYMQLLEERVFLSGTYAGDRWSLGRVLQTLATAHRTQPWTQMIAHGEMLASALQGICVGYPTRLRVTLPEELHRRFVTLLAARGVLVGWDFFQMAAHTAEDIVYAIQAIEHTRTEIGL